ncbi:MAG: hypothetical protein IT370_25990 [Deltaproteobacteria bacterium]|nr:hypothetical protein [Deltaproteobacteria bacterium]
MGWAAGYMTRLAAGETVSFCPRGNSMAPKIRSGRLCTVTPVDAALLKVGDIVLCKVGRAEYLHFIKAIDRDGPRFQIGNNRGGINGWIGAAQIFGRLTRIDP